MSDTMFDLGRRHSELCDADPVVKVARAREQALEAWGEAQEEAAVADAISRVPSQAFLNS